MRKVLLIISALALAIAPLSAATASTKYKITIGVGPQDIDVSAGHSDAKVTIHGTVTGGPVKGKTVKIYRVNESGPDQTKVHVHNLTLPSSGKYSTTDHPPLGGHYVYSAIKPGTTGATATHHLDAYQFDYARIFLAGDQAGIEQDPLVDGKKETSPGTGSGGYGSAFAVAVEGSIANTTLTFDSTGNRCTNISYHIAISNESDLPESDTPYRYDILKGGVEVYHHRMAVGDDPQEPTKTEKKLFASKPDGAFSIRIPDANVRFLVGNPKIACTYPDPSNAG